jgi:hypothetical protein
VIPVENQVSLHNAFFRIIEKKSLTGSIKVTVHGIPSRGELMAKVSKPIGALVAVIKLKLAKYVALGISLGEDLNRVLQRFVRPLVVARLEPEYHDMVPPLLNELSMGFCVLFAVFGSRYLNIVVTSVRGAFTVTRNIQELSVSRGWGVFNPETSRADFYLVCTLIPIGISFQTFVYPLLPGGFRAFFLPTYIRDALLIGLINMFKTL